MSASLVVTLAIIASTLAAATVVGVHINRRSGALRATSAEVGGRTELGLSRTGPTVVHVSAVWCGPCTAVRRVVDQVCGDLPAVAHVEIDVDANPAVARQLSVLSLPTTLIFDAEGKQRYRAAGVPKAADLRASLLPLLA